MPAGHHFLIGFAWHLFNFAGNTPAEKITLILMTPGHFSTGQTGLEIPFLCPLGITFEMPAGHYFLLMGIGQTGLKKRHQTGVWMSCLESLLGMKCPLGITF